MTHPFRKLANNTSGLPSRMSSYSWNKIAHEVWDIDGSGDSPVVVRKREETAEIHDDEDVLCPNDIVQLILGGRRLQASVISRDEAGFLKLALPDGILEDIHESWLEVMAQAMQEPAEPDGSETVDNIARLLESKGGHVGLRISPSTVLEVKTAGANGEVQACLWEISTKPVHEQIYSNIQSLVQELGLKGWHEQVPVETLRRR